MIVLWDLLVWGQQVFIGGRAKPDTPDMLKKCPQDTVTTEVVNYPGILINRS